MFIVTEYAALKRNLRLWGKQLRLGKRKKKH